MFKIKLLCILCLYATHFCDAYKALVTFPFPAKSHSILGDGIVRHLLEDGQEVTYITAFPKILKQHKYLREVDISSLQNVIPKSSTNIENMKNEIDLKSMMSFVTVLFQVQIDCLEHEEVKKLLNNPKEKFDVVIIDWMFVELMSGISAVYNCPYIWASSLDPHWMVLKLIDDVTNTAYTADFHSSNVVAPFSFMQRVVELLKTALALGFQNFFVSRFEHREYERLLAPIMRNRGLKVPDFEEVRYNASLMLGNSHVSMGQPIRLPQNYKPLGGYHIDVNVNPLPEDLKKILDSAKHGVIYFSLGTNVRSKDFPSEIKASLLEMFGKLKQIVLWKFEDYLPNRPSNVHIIQWAPQQSILAHPNCVLFITHGGLLSITEAVHFGKPIIGIPVFADQFNNVDRSAMRGFAKRVNLSYGMADELEKAIKDIITDPSYVNKVKALSFIYHDRPVSPGKELAHWVKHVVRTGGGAHLRSPALMVPWYQKCYLDLAVLVIVVLLYIAILVIKKIRSLYMKREKKKIN